MLNNINYNDKKQNSTSRLVKKKAWWGIFLIIIVFFLWIVWGNMTVETHKVNIYSNNLPVAFSGYRIAQISDLHNARFGDDNSKLIDILKTEQPDIIAITGDFIDSNHTDIEIALEFAKNAVKIAPCYYVTGNHEAWIGIQYLEFETKLKEYGVIVLRDTAVNLEKDGSTVQLIGLDDPGFVEYDGSISQNILSIKLVNMNLQEGYKILLSHRPEAFHAYVENSIDVVLSGHAHGGQIRIPFVGGLIAPNQGFFPKYDSGIYKKENTSMVVSRGIGNSIIPVRINNRPEIVVIELYVK